MIGALADPGAVRWRSIVLGVLIALASCGGKGERATDGPAAACSAAPADLTGEGTYYDADGTGNCSFAASPGDLMVAAMNDPDYDGAARCGACVAVTGPNGSVVVRIVDRCPGCAHGDLDLSREAFAVIAPLAAGRVPITWREVACEVTGPIRYRFKEGSNPFWTAIQLRNHRYAIAALAARNPDGSWRELPRLAYNYFVADPGLGDGPYALRVTDQRGHVLEDESIALGDGAERAGAAQLERCP